MVKIIDRRNKSMGGNDKRSTSKITNIAVHYSATTQGNTSSFENFWKGTHGWNTGGYHEVVLTNGDVELNYDANVISNGVGGQNTRMYNICYVGAGKPNDKQLKTLKERVNYNRNRFNISANNVKGHREYSGQSTSCPALDMAGFRKSLGNTSSSSSKTNSKPNTKPSKSGKANMTTNSIVVYLQSIGQPYSFAHRAKLAQQNGIKNYKGSSVQNLMLLDKLRKGGTTRTTSKPKTSTTSKSKKYPLPTGVLRRGSTGNGVRQLQRALNAANFKVGKVDGIYGAKTEDAVRRFQSVHDAYNVDGVYGSRTRSRLDKKVN